MSNLDIRPVALKGAPNFRPFRVPAYMPKQPQTFFDSKRMGKKKSLGAFSTEALPLALGASVASVGAIILGSGIRSKPDQPTPVLKPLLIGAGLVGLGFSIWYLFSGKEQAPAGVQPTGNAAPTPSVEAFDQVVGSFKSPRMYENIDRFGPDFLNTPNFRDIPIKFSVTNPSREEDVTLTLRFTQQENATGLLFNSTDKATYYKTVTIPRGTSVPVDFDMDTLNWGGSLAEKLVAEKLRTSDPNEKAVKLSEVTFFV